MIFSRTLFPICLSATAAVAGVDGAPPLFTRLGPEVTGLAEVNHMDVESPMSYLYHSGMTCGGVAVADFDGDGKPDIFLAGTNGPNRLYRQTGDLKFTDITAQCAAEFDGGDRWTAGASVADVNGDGRLDLYLCNYMRPNQLWLNLGPGKNGEPVTFRECAEEAGLDLVDCSHSAAFADYDGDGKLDLYILTNRIEDPAGSPKEMPIVKGGPADALPALLPEAEKYYHIWRWDFNTWGTEAIGTPDRLYRQKGVKADGTPEFEETTEKAGIAGKGDGLSVTWWDPDADGDPDLYIGNDFLAADKWYRNNGDGTFTDILRESVPHTPWFSMGADFGDVNNDGRLDLLVADMSATSHYKSKTTMGVMGGTALNRSYFDTPPQYMRNALYINTGTGRFLEGASAWKVSSTDWTWSVKFADFDLDGWQDLYFTNGISRHMNDSDYKITAEDLVGKHMFDFFKNGEMRKEMNRAYQNEHGQKFAEVSKEWGLDHTGVSYGAAWADLDGDGDLDLVEVNLEEPDFIYRNDVKNGNWLEVKLRGAGANRDGIGAMVTAKTAHGTQVRYLSPQSGYLSCNEAIVHFGLGADTEAEVSVRWPFAGVQTVGKTQAGQRIVVQQEADTRPATVPAPATQFRRLDALTSARQADAGWEGDFRKPLQSLLPWALSQLGPCVACADVNGDGLPDFYTGAAAGRIGELRLNAGGGKFTLQYVAAFAADKASEDQGAVFFDADGDGDPDLYVVSGSNEFDTGAPELRDRLYLNDGKGKFTAAPAGSLPADALDGSCAVAADFDSDGDTDLFVGTRMLPGAYPQSEASRLLRNDGKGKFTATPLPADGSADTWPMVTGATAADIDGDGRSDLVIATEWGAVRYFHQQDGTLTEMTAPAGLAETTGFWNSVTAADVDGDGDLDLIAGNIGLNSKYKMPAADHPHLAYYGDFDGKGRQFVEVKREGDTLYPERGRSCSSRAMPFIADKFKTFKTFATASLQDIYPGEKLAASRLLSITEFQSGIFRNDGGRFTFAPLPRLAQLSPAFGLVATDLTGDGNTDLFLNQNFIRGPQIETAAFDGGVGQLLTGDGKGNFTPVEPALSGLVIPGDNRAAAVLDLDGNGTPDLLGGQNDGVLQPYVNGPGNWLAVRLPAGTAATVRLTREGTPTQTVALSPGSGYWSQDDSVAWFGLGDSPDKPGTITLTAGGRKSQIAWDGKSRTLTLSPP